MNAVRNPYTWLMDMRAGGAVTRYHTARMLRPQSVADHSWGVAVALLAAGLANPNTLTAALLHDVAEQVTGDVPAPAKWRNPALRALLHTVEDEFNVAHGIDMRDGDDLTQAALSWADVYDLCCWCLEERLMGNQYALEVLTNGIGVLDDRVDALRMAGAAEATLTTVRSLNTQLKGAYEHGIS